MENGHKKAEDMNEFELVKYILEEGLLTNNHLIELALSKDQMVRLVQLEEIDKE